MKTRVERFKKHRNSILLYDDGDLPIAKSSGKHLKKDGNISSTQVSYKKKRIRIIDEDKKSKIIIILLSSLIVALIIIGIIMSI